MIKNITTIALLSLLTVCPIYAFDFQVGTLCYNLVSMEQHTCEIAENPNTSAYKGNFVIPTTVSFKNTPFKVVGIGKGAFSNTSILSIKIPLSIRTIGSTAFSMCRNLVSVHIPDSVNSIGDNCFSCCVRLQRVRLPEHLSYLGSDVFSKCTLLTSVNIPTNLSKLDMTFWECSNLRSIHLPQSLRTLGTRTFSECMGLSSITLPDSIETIGSYCFADSKTLSKIIFPKSLKKIGFSAFSGCLGITELSFPPTLKEIDSFSFQKCANLKSVTFPDSLKELSVGVMQGYTFSECKKLSTIKFNDRLESIGEFCFAHCTSLRKIDLPASLVHLERFCFGHCTNLREVTLPPKLEYLNDGVFMDCHLQKLRLGANIYGVGMNGVNWCDTLIIEDSKEHLKVDNGATKLNSKFIYFGRELDYQVVDSYCFYLQAFELGPYVKNLYFLWEIDREHVKSIRCYSKTPPHNSNFKARDYMNISVTVPKGCVETYKNDPEWGKFLTIIEAG